MPKPLIVIVIVGIGGVLLVASLAGVVGLSLGGKSHKELRAETDIHEIRMALRLYRMEIGKYPDSLDRLLEPTEVWKDGFLLHNLSDPWKRPYSYAATGGTRNVFIVSSDGKDGIRGTEDDITSDTVAR